VLAFCDFSALGVFRSARTGSVFGAESDVEVGVVAEARISSVRIFAEAAPSVMES